MENNKDDSTLNISGVPKEVQENIIHDLVEHIHPESLPIAKHKVGISVSDNEDLAELGYSNIHLRDLTIEIVRHLIINGSSIVYGGDLRKENYTEIFSELAYQYRSIKQAKEKFFENYFSFPIYCLLTKQNELDFKKYNTDIFKVSPPVNLGVDPEKYIVPDTLESKFIWGESLSEMRNVMIQKTNARILIGGKVNNYLGKMPGVIQEAKITLKLNKPLYLIGAFGGSSKEVINAIQGKGLSYYKNEFHTSDSYIEFKKFYNSKNSVELIQPEEDSKFFEEYGIKKLSEINGLTVDENNRLFTTTHLSEILYYILKGMSNIQKKTN